MAPVCHARATAPKPLGLGLAYAFENGKIETAAITIYTPSRRNRYKFTPNGTEPNRKEQNRTEQNRATHNCEEHTQWRNGVRRQ